MNAAVSQSSLFDAGEHFYHMMDSVCYITH